MRDERWYIEANCPSPDGSVVITTFTMSIYECCYWSHGTASIYDNSRVIRVYVAARHSPPGSVRANREWKSGRVYKQASSTSAIESAVCARLEQRAGCGLGLITISKIRTCQPLWMLPLLCCLPSILRHLLRSLLLSRTFIKSCVLYAYSWYRNASHVNYLEFKLIRVIALCN